eukprot:1577250-Rhodomonas_salina.1
MGRLQMYPPTRIMIRVPQAIRVMIECQLPPAGVLSSLLDGSMRIQVADFHICANLKGPRPFTQKSGS